MKDQNYTTIDLEKSTILHSGNSDLACLKEAIAILASHIAFKRYSIHHHTPQQTPIHFLFFIFRCSDSLPLYCHLYLIPNHKPLLVFDPSNCMLEVIAQKVHIQEMNKLIKQ
jgi:hypothetical protein